MLIYLLGLCWGVSMCAAEGRTVLDMDKANILACEEMLLQEKYLQKSGLNFMQCTQEMCAWLREQKNTLEQDRRRLAIERKKLKKDEEMLAFVKRMMQVKRLSRRQSQATLEAKESMQDDWTDWAEVAIDKKERDKKPQKDLKRVTRNLSSYV